MASLLGLLFLWPVLLIVAVLVKVKMPGGITVNGHDFLLKIEKMTEIARNRNKSYIFAAD